MKHPGVNLKSIEIVRRRVVSGLSRELVSLRSFISGIDGNQDAVERLRGDGGAKVLAILTDCLMNQLGAPTVEGGENANSPSARAARKALKGEAVEA